MGLEDRIRAAVTGLPGVEIKYIKQDLKHSPNRQLESLRSQRTAELEPALRALKADSLLYEVKEGFKPRNIGYLWGASLADGPTTSYALIQGIVGEKCHLFSRDEYTEVSYTPFLPGSWGTAYPQTGRQYKGTYHHRITDEARVLGICVEPGDNGSPLAYAFFKRSGSTFGGYNNHTKDPNIVICLDAAFRFKPIAVDIDHSESARLALAEQLFSFASEFYIKEGYSSDV